MMMNSHQIKAYRSPELGLLVFITVKGCFVFFRFLTSLPPKLTSLSSQKHLVFQETRFRASQVSLLQHALLVRKMMMLGRFPKLEKSWRMKPMNFCPSWKSVWNRARAREKEKIRKMAGKSSSQVMVPQNMQHQQSNPPVGVSKTRLECLYWQVTYRLPLGVFSPTVLCQGGTPPGVTHLCRGPPGVLKTVLVRQYWYRKVAFLIVLSSLHPCHQFLWFHPRLPMLKGKDKTAAQAQVWEISVDMIAEITTVAVW